MVSRTTTKLVGIPMTQEEFMFLASEIKELESLLASIPETNVINRWGLEKRLQSARRKIENVHSAANSPASGHEAPPPVE